LSTTPDHDHFDNLVSTGDNIDFPNETWEPGSGGAHTHATSIPVSISLPRKKLAHYVALGTAPIEVGAIIGFHGDGALPPGWYDADGNNGTHDTVDYWIERSSVAAAGGEIAGNKTVSWSGTTSPGGQHNHKRGASAVINFTTRNAFHGDDDAHVHTVSGSAAYEPPSYALRFIQYTGVV
jgi:hypothetical protein